MNRLGTAERASIISALVEGHSLRATAHVTGAARMTVERLLRDTGAACRRMHDERARGLKSRRVRCVDIWSFGADRKRAATSGTSGKHPAADEAWTWTAIDADSRLMLWWMVGNRDAPTAHQFLTGVSARLANRVRLTTDGSAVQLQALDGAPADDIDYAALTSLYGGGRDGRHSPPRLKSAGRAPTRSRPDRRIEMHGHSVALHAAHYNFCQDPSRAARHPCDGGRAQQSRLVARRARHAARVVAGTAGSYYMHVQEQRLI